MINLPTPGTDEYYQFKAEQHHEEAVQENILKLRQAHELKVKELELEVARTEVSLQASLRMILAVLKVPFFLLAIIPITVLILANRKVPTKLWDILKV